MGQQTGQIANRLREKGEETLTYFAGLAPDQWQAEVYTEGARWTVHTVLCHFVSAERAFVRLVRNVLAGGEGTPEGFDIDAFNAAQVEQLSTRGPVDLLDQFRAARHEMVALVAGMDDSDLERMARHPYLGVDKMEQFLKLIYRHNMIHERDVRKALDAVQ
jgi:uncharacterized protein (TIGR03083 family)